MPVLVVHPNILGKFFAKSSISLTNENLVFTQKSDRENTLPLASVRTLFQVKKRFLGYELQLPGAKTSVRYRFLKADNVEALQAAANKIIRTHIKAYLHTVFTLFNNKVNQAMILMLFKTIGPVKINSQPVLNQGKCNHA